MYCYLLTSAALPNAEKKSTTLKLKTTFAEKKEMNVKTKFERGVRRTDGHAAAAAAAGGGSGAAASVSAPRRNMRSVIQVEVVESFAPISDEQLVSDEIPL